MKLFHKFAWVALLSQCSPLFAASCEDSFKAEGDPRNGAEYFATTLVSDLSVTTAMGQLQTIATADGFKVHNDKSNLKEGKLIIEQVSGSRPFLILITGVEKGTASALFIQTRLNPGASAKTEDMRQAMCGMLARVKGATDSSKTFHTAIAGTSTINGTAFAKVALLTPKQYPPKGSVVGIIPLTDEVRRWIATANKGQATSYPQEIKKLVSYTKIEDDKGRFTFNNLPSGEYIVHISFGFFGNRHYQQYEGTDVVVDRRSGAVVSSQDRVSQQSASEARSAIVEKNVTIKNDGDIVDVELSKSDIFAKGSILNPRW